MLTPWLAIVLQQELPSSIIFVLLLDFFVIIVVLLFRYLNSIRIEMLTFERSGNSNVLILSSRWKLVQICKPVVYHQLVRGCLACNNIWRNKAHMVKQRVNTGTNFIYIFCLFMHLNIYYPCPINNMQCTFVSLSNDL